MAPIKDFFAREMKLRAMSEENTALLRQLKLMALVVDDVEAVLERDKRYKGNAYQSYSEAVKELAAKYNGTAEWGVLQTGNIIDVRAAFISAGGLKIYPNKASALKKSPDKKPDLKSFAANEMDFIQRFLEANSLDHEMVQQFAREGELEGRFLAELVWDPDKGMVILQYRPWLETGYTVKNAPRDYTRFIEASWSQDSKSVTVKEPAFAYAKLAGRVHKADDPYPKVAKCLTQIENLDKAIRDWREIDSLFAAPVPDVEFADAKVATAAAPVIEKMNFKIRKAFVHTGTFGYKSPDMAGTASLEREITMLSKMISGTTGTPVHFLGLPDLMSNRATADNLMELVSHSTSRERYSWIGFYQSVIAKAAAIYNDKSQKTKVDPTLLKVNIPYITQETWTKLDLVYLPLFQANAISLETLLSQLPEVDIDEEIERIEKRKEQGMERFAAISGKDEEDDEDEDEEDS